MKKLLLVLAVASFAVACNNSGEKKDSTDSPAVSVDTTTAPAVDTNAAPAVDTTAKKDTTMK